MYWGFERLLRRHETVIFQKDRSFAPVWTDYLTCIPEEKKNQDNLIKREREREREEDVNSS